MKSHLLLVASVVILFSVMPVEGADWPQYLGPDKNKAARETGLVKAWPKGGPPLLWTYSNAGVGLAGPAVVGQVLFTLGARDDADVVFALDLKSVPPRELWATKVG